MGIADGILGPANEAAERPRKINGANSGMWSEVNDLDPQAVGDRLGIDHDGKKIRACPCCGADSGVDFVRGGWKCLHASCSGMGKNGFRTNIDSIMEIRQCSAIEAARWASEEFRTPAPGADKPRTTQPRGSAIHDDVPADYYDRMVEAVPEAQAADRSETPPKINGKGKRQTKIGVKEGIQHAFQVVQERNQRGGRLAGIESGYTRLDYAFDGWQRKKMYVLGARAGMGKSIMSLELSLRFAEAGHRVLYFTLEMTNEEQILRALFNRAQVGISRMKANAIYPEHWSKLTTAAASIANLPLHFDEACGLTDSEIERRVVAHKQEHGDLFAVVVDHTLLVHGTNDRQPRREQLNGIIESLKSIAKDHAVCVIALTQLNRALESRSVKDKRPQMSDLKETGAFEEFADAVMLLYREDYYHFGESDYDRDNVLEIIIPKLRGGYPTKAKLEFVGKQCRINQPESDREIPKDYNETRDE